MKQRKIPIRTCVACRTSGEKKSLIRIVRTSEGRVVVDATGKLSGRGAYLCASAECFRRAVKEKRLSKALRTEVPDEVLEQIEKIISQGSEEM
ncbi:MAG: YlxR family protein, partial [Armatimonadota bacterium]|nr:YlxR family protein [Armatimonadota bacterium]